MLDRCGVESYFLQEQRDRRAERVSHTRSSFVALKRGERWYAPGPLTGSAPGHCIDVVIVTAIKDEYDEALEVDTGAIEAEWDVRPGPTGLGVAFRSYRARDGGVLRIALTRALEMRGVATAAAVTPLLTEYKPRCVAMCGVCAGRRGDVDLGDVIIADKLWTYDVGSLKAGRFKPETTTYLLAATWKHPAENFVISPDAEWLADRPVPLELQTRWVLEMLERGEDPLRHAERLVRCADWSAALERLWQHKLLLEDRVELSAKGRKLIKREMLKHPDGLPPQPDFRTHVGPIATGNNVVRDPKIFDKLAGTDRKVLGVEMEAAAVGAIAHLHDIDQIVMKAAMDFGDLDKNDNFKQFAARAAAECLIAFLRANMASDKAGQGVLTPGTFERPSQMSPAASLNAKYELVPFFPDARRAELTALEQWLDDDKQPVAIRLFYGPGGAGKTRLMIETCKARRDLGWSAGFLAPEVTDDEFDTVLAEAKDTLVVLDYAEARPGLRERLDRVVKMLGRRAHRLRVVLLARTISDWWRRLLEHSDGLRNMVQTDAPIELAMVEATGPMRTRMFDAAFGAFRANTGEPGGSPPRTDLGEARYARPLYIHMAALAAAEGVVIQAGELLEYVLDHEQRFWTGHFRASAVLDEDAFKRAARWSVAAVTLRGGAPTREEAEGITEKVGGPRQSQFVDFLRRLYPGSDRPEATDCYVSALEPDLIGETVVLRVLKDMDTPRDYLDRVFDGAPRAAMRQGFIVLGRVALGHPEEMQPWLEAALHADILTRARAAMDAAMAFTTQTAFAPLGLLVAERLQQVRSVKGTEQLELARSLESEIPDQTVSLREVAAWVFATLIAHLPAGSDEKILSERARLLNNLGIRLGALGRREEALEATKEAVEHYTQLVEALPAAFMQNFLISVRSLTRRLAELEHAPELDPTLVAAAELIERLGVETGPPVDEE